jgi:hypothetical protein
MLLASAIKSPTTNLSGSAFFRVQFTPAQIQERASDAVQPVLGRQ